MEFKDLQMNNQVLPFKKIEKLMEAEVIKEAEVRFFINADRLFYKLSGSIGDDLMEDFFEALYRDL